MNNITGIHRDFVIPHMENKMHLFARKMKDMYIKENFLPPRIPIVKGLRL